MMNSDRICIIPKVHGVGGMVSFLHKFSTAVEAYGVQVTNDLADRPYRAVLVIGGTRALLPLYRAKQHGARVVQRLDGINWIQRRKPVSIRHTLRAEYGNLILSLIRRFFAERIVYQSKFSRDWWQDWFGPLTTPATVIYNGVDLERYQPGSAPATEACYRLLVVEGSLGGGYESGLENAVRLAETAAGLLPKPLELHVVGKVSAALRSEWSARSQIPIHWQGLVAREAIPDLMRSAHALFSADIHPACPNAVIEALACGLPVVAYDTGSLTELVTPNAGALVPYGADPWQLEPPVPLPLARGLVQVLENQARFRAGARARAEATLDVQVMMKKYVEALLR